MKITKQYKQLDGTLITVEGEEWEIEAFEKKQRKQKASIEKEQAEQRKKTVLYGRDLEEIRKIVQEEIAKAPPKTVYEYRYIPNPYYSNPWWVNPWVNLGHNQPGIMFTTNQVASNGIALGDVNSTAVNGVSQDAVGAYDTENSKLDLYVSKFNSNGGACGGGIPTGQAWSGVLSPGGAGGASSGWGSKASNFLMSPVGVGG